MRSDVAAAGITSAEDLSLTMLQLRLACSVAASHFPSVVACFCQENKQ